MGIVRNANSLEPIADPTMERWFTDAFRTKNPVRWKQIADTITGTTPAGYLGCCGSTCAGMAAAIRRRAITTR